MHAHNRFNIGEVSKPISDLFMVNRYLHTPLGRSEASYRTFSYIGTHVWNHMSQNVSINVLYIDFNKIFI